MQSTQEKTLTSPSTVSDSRYTDPKLRSTALSDFEMVPPYAEEGPSKYKWIWILLVTFCVLVIAFSLWTKFFPESKYNGVGEEKQTKTESAQRHITGWESSQHPELPYFKVACSELKKCTSEVAELSDFAKNVGLVYYRLKKSEDCKWQTMSSSTYTGMGSTQDGLYQVTVEQVFPLMTGDKYKELEQRRLEVVEDPATRDRARRDAFIELYRQDKELRKKITTAIKMAKQVLKSACPSPVEGERFFLTGEYEKTRAK